MPSRSECLPGGVGIAWGACGMRRRAMVGSPDMAWLVMCRARIVWQRCDVLGITRLVRGWACHGMANMAWQCGDVLDITQHGVEMAWHGLTWNRA